MIRKLLEFANMSVTVKLWHWTVICLTLPIAQDFLKGFFAGLLGGTP